jgi:hypothetical protein
MWESLSASLNLSFLIGKMGIMVPTFLGGSKETINKIMYIKHLAHISAQYMWALFLSLF